MLLPVAFYLLAVSVAVTLAALLVEDAVRRLGLATRCVWVAALLAPGTLLGTAWAWPQQATAPLDVGVGALAVIPLPASGGAAWAMAPAWDTVFAMAWIASTTALLALLGTSHLRLIRRAAAWSRAEVQGRLVWLTDDVGPAVAGLVRPRIVLPRWSLSLPNHELDLVLQHEEEHIRARDPLLRLIALAAVAATAWNPVAWLQLRRLRAAVEIDCDRRVLRRTADPAAYGASLLTVAARCGVPAFGFAAFAEGPQTLERRILAMTERSNQWTPLRVGAALACGFLIGLQACAVDAPVRESADPEPESAVIPAPSASTGTTDLPAPERPDVEGAPAFDVAPALVNRDQVVASLEENYPPLLREAGVGGVTRIWMFIDRSGTVQDVRIAESSGHQALDDGALRVAMDMRFDPAQNDGAPVEVWVSVPVTFRVR